MARTLFSVHLLPQLDIIVSFLIFCGESDAYADSRILAN